MPTPTLLDVRVLGRRVLRTAVTYRRPLAAGLVVLAALSAVQSLRPASASGEAVVVAARSIEANTVLQRDDLRVVQLPAPVAPSDGVSDPADLVGQRTSGPIGENEPVTSVRIASSGGLAAAAGSGRVALPVRVADADAIALLQVGSVVDVLAADGRGAARVVAGGAQVLALPEVSTDSFSGGALVVVAVSSATATSLAGAAAVGPLSIALRG